VQFQKTINALLLNSYESVLFVDSLENLYITGTFRSGGVPSNPVFACIAKFNSSGIVQWARSYGTSGQVFAGRGIAADSGGNVYVVAGAALGSTPNTFNFLKYNSSGTLQWQKNLFNASFSIYTVGLVIDSSDNIYIAGAQSSGSGRPSFILKYDTSGTLQWQTSFLTGAAGNLFTNDIAVDLNGNVYGIADGSTFDPVVVKLNSSGTLQWANSYSNISRAAGFEAITTDNEGNVYIAVSNKFAKFDPAGNVQWGIHQTTGNVTALTGSKPGKLIIAGYPFAGNNPQIQTSQFPNNGTKPNGTYTIGGQSVTYNTNAITRTTYNAGVGSLTLSETTASEPETSAAVTTTDISFTQSFLSI
jgi:hypothetical protein